MLASEFLIDESGETQVVSLLTTLLERVLEANSHRPMVAAPSPSRLVAEFQSFRAPAISLREYVSRIYEYSSCSASSLVVAMIYTKRLLRKDSSLVLSAFNVHRIIAITAMLGAKYVDDLHYDNKYWARVAGISLQELNRLELLLLAALDWNLVVSPEAFQFYYRGIVDGTVRPVPWIVVPTPRPASARLTAARSSGRQFDFSEDAIAASCRVSCC